jgi:hypothetical protein
MDLAEQRSVPRQQNKTPETPVGPGLILRTAGVAAKPSAGRGTRDRQAQRLQAPAHAWIPESLAVQGPPLPLHASGLRTGTSDLQPSGQETGHPDLGLRGHCHATWRRPKRHRSSGRRRCGCHNLQKRYCNSHREKNPSQDLDCRVLADRPEHFLRSLHPAPSPVV